MSRPMDSWASFAGALRDRTVIAFDAPGVGASETPCPVLDAHVVGCRCTGPRCSRHREADVVGYSHGGAVAQQFAVGHPTRVNRLVLLATACGVGAVPGRPSDVTQIVLTPNRGTRWPRPDPLGLLWQILAISTWSSIPVLGCIDVPTLVVCGDHDRAVPPANSRLLAARIPDARLITIQDGHDLQKPRSAAIVAQLVDQFLDSETSTPNTKYRRSGWQDPDGTNASRKRAVIRTRRPYWPRRHACSGSGTPTDSPVGAA